ncbi:hypothetical protein TRIATDRAFT_258766 [Trichoderma atroviride IMI 206040]|uniref:Uncharacterized protein n=1 Tax=Hypocrea atroviridis (strain ATCC 20476 / IMI 206040) TaxID=452589 RepID=G9P6I4_HYPAI|nr:uncharacterized protein TRIATDRAFT_258766 [Trichoderma atroviride IMI 206040]EHK40628.1 hypothetical protein TRIATDRAFT_258766 [Trichoderma atroviride IMI 206040]
MRFHIRLSKQEIADFRASQKIIQALDSSPNDHAKTLFYPHRLRARHLSIHWPGYMV